MARLKRDRRKAARSWLFLLPIALLAAGLGYWSPGNDSLGKRPASPGEQTIDFYMTNSKIVQFNEQGQLHYSFNAERLDHVQQTDVSLMHKPDLELWRGSEYPWHITSERGQASPGGEQIDLYDKVRIERHDAKQRPFVLTTSELSYQTETDFARTDKPIQIDSAQGVTTATGMNAYLKQGTVKLLSTVRGRYETD